MYVYIVYICTLHTHTQKPGMLLILLHCIGQPPQQIIIWPNISTVLSLSPDVYIYVTI